jgi:hypothetical protein
MEIEVPLCAGRRGLVRASPGRSHPLSFGDRVVFAVSLSVCMVIEVSSWYVRLLFS